MGMETAVSLIVFLIGVAVLVVIHLCIVGRIFRRGYENREDKIPESISNEDLKNLPSFNFMAPGGQESTSGDCVVCLEMFNDGDKCRLLPNCNHSFHAHCIDLWLLKTAVCPICRTRVGDPKIQILNHESSIPVAVRVELT